MRRITLAASVVGLLLFGLPGTGSAITIVDDPLNFAFGSTTGSIDFLPSSTSTQLVMKVTVTSGDLDSLSLLACETEDCNADGVPDDREPTSVGSFPGPGVDVTNAFISTFADVSFANFEFGNFKKNQTMSDVFFVDYSGDPLESGDYLIFALTDFKGKSSTAGVAITQVPEPTALLFLGLGLGGLTFAGTRLTRH